MEFWGWCPRLGLSDVCVCVGRGGGRGGGGEAVGILESSLLWSIGVHAILF